MGPGAAPTGCDELPGLRRRSETAGLVDRSIERSGAFRTMAIEVETKDCTHLSDAELAEMADICADGPSRFEAGLLSKQAEEWVLVTLARESDKLKGFSFCTLERIGGTPCVLIGLASVKRTSKRDTVLRGLMNELFRRAVLAFPDEDVLVGTRFVDPAGSRRSGRSTTSCPGPATRRRARSGRGAGGWPSGSASRTAPTTTAPSSSPATAAFPCVLDHESLKPETIDEAVRDLFGGVERARGDSLIAFGWAMAEDLAKYGD